MDLMRDFFNYLMVHELLHYKDQILLNVLYHVSLTLKRIYRLLLFIFTECVLQFSGLIY